MFQCKRAGGYAFKGETHDFWECLYVKKGRVCVSGDERVYNMNEGEIIFHKPLELHKYYVEDNDFAELFIFSFSLDGALAEFFEHKCFKLNEKQEHMMKEILEFIDSENLLYPETTGDTKTLKNLSKSNVHMQMIANYVCNFFLSICDGFNVVTETQTEEYVIFGKAVKYMQDNINTTVTVREIAEYCCISETGLKKIFAQISGFGVHKYFLQLKINKANRMLEEGCSVTECAEKLGFSSQAYFSEAFKRERGVSPGGYKK